MTLRITTRMAVATVFGLGLLGAAFAAAAEDRDDGANAAARPAAKNKLALCYSKRTGEVRMPVKRGSGGALRGRCRKSELRLRVNRQGQRGAIGPAGPEGVAGPAGANGPRGATGPAGQTGATGQMGATGQTGATGATGPADGPAGGALAGNYPNPTLASGAITGVGAFAAGAVPAARVVVDAEDLGFGPGDGTVFSFVTEVFDVGDMFSIEEFNYLTAPTAGIYAISANAPILNWEQQSFGGIELVRNDTQVIASDFAAAQDGTGIGAVSASTTMLMDPGDTVSVVFRSSSASEAIEVSTDASLTMHWVGPPPSGG